MTPAKHATFVVPGVMNTILHASDTGVTTELQFENAIQVEWFDKTLSESYLGLKAPPKIILSLFSKVVTQEHDLDTMDTVGLGLGLGLGKVVTQEHDLDTMDTVVKRIQVHLVRNMS